MDTTQTLTQLDVLFTSEFKLELVYDKIPNGWKLLNDPSTNPSCWESPDGKKQLYSYKDEYQGPELTMQDMMDYLNKTYSCYEDACLIKTFRIENKKVV